ncbi:MAG: hypothetical protein WBA25_01995 [Jannaschia sp.]
MGIDYIFQVIIHNLDTGKNALLFASPDLGFEPLADIVGLTSPGRQSSENTTISIWQFSPGFRSECHEPGDEFRVDPISLRSRAPGKREGLDLCRGQLHSSDARSGKFRPEHPLLATRGLNPTLTGPEKRWIIAISTICPSAVCLGAGTAAGQEGRTRPASRVIHLSQEGLSQLSCHSLLLMLRGPAKRAAVNCSRR